MSLAIEHLRRSVRAEVIRTAGRGPLWTVLAPVATLLPAAVTLGIASLAEHFARIPGQRYVQQVPTSNAAYWVVTITVVMTAIAAAFERSHESNLGQTRYIAALLPRPWTVLGGKWLFYGALGAIAAAVLVITLLVALPHVAPLVYGEVSVTDTVGRRLLWTVPVFAFFAAGLGVGIGGCTRSPAAAVGLILFWVYVVELAVSYLPGGLSLQRFMPFLNGVYATGQDIVLEPPWGPDIALCYVCALFTAVFTCGVRAARTR